MIPRALLVLGIVALAGAQHVVDPAWPDWFVGNAPAGPERRLTQAAGSYCGPLTKELVQRVARDNTVLVTVIDKIVWKCFGPSFVENIQAANISYWLVAALDPETSVALAAAGVTQCFNAPQDRLKYKGAETAYKWGSYHWTQTTWNKVHVMRAVYELGVHVVHSDADVVWFNDPHPYFHERLAGPAHVVICTDAVSTANKRGDGGLEADTHPNANINTGVYFMKQWAGGMAFLDTWLGWQDKNVGHDQDGFNFLTRGALFHGTPSMPLPIMPPRQERMFYAAFSNTTAISFLPASSFGNAYTYVNARLWEKLAHPLYSIHWVWGGSTMESKRQNMRDAMKFHDEPGYYTPSRLLTFELDQLQMPSGFNSWPLERTEEMIRFHVTAANHQLQQTYFAFAAALITNRTLVMPRFQCFCSKNWYQTQSCRINHETATTFPFVCALSHVMRVKRLQQGFSLPGNTEYSGHRVFVREYSFLENPKVPEDIKRSYLEVVPSALPRPPGLATDKLVLSLENTTGGAGRPAGRRLTVAAPLADYELRAVLAPYADVRVVHFPQPGRTLTGFAKAETAVQYDEEIQKRVTYWCCRTPPDMKAWNLSEALQLVALPPSRYQHLATIGPRASYLHKQPPMAQLVRQ